MSEEYQDVSGSVSFRLAKKGVIRLEGVDRLDLLGRLSTADLTRLTPGMTAQTILTSEKGRIVDLLDVIVEEDHLILLSSFEDPGPAIEWIDRYIIMDDVTVIDRSEDLDVVAIYGDQTVHHVRTILSAELPAAGTRTTGSFEGKEVMIVRGDNICGPFSAFILIDSYGSGDLLDRLAAEGAVGMNGQTYRKLRIEAGRPGPLTELGLHHNPLELGLSSLVSFTKGCYIGQEVIARLDSYDKVKNRLIGVRINSGVLEDIEEGEYQVRSIDENDVIGRITSHAHSPGIGTIALAIVRSLHANPQTPVTIARAGEPAAIAEGVLSMLPFA